MFEKQRDKLIAGLEANGIWEPRVLDAFKTVPREAFVLDKYISQAYEDTALPIQSGQTISQPYIIALMTQALAQIKGIQKVLELGTGSGYQAAILGKIFPQVYTIERIEELYHLAKERLNKLHLNHVHTLFGDGYEGWASQAPFDGILITAAPETIPQNLLEQLNPQGGRMVIPVGSKRAQTLKIIDRHENSFEEKTIERVLFVPLLPGTKK